MPLPPFLSGDHAGVLVLRRPLAAEALQEGLRRLGFVHVLVGDGDPLTANPSAPVALPFVGTVDRAFQPRQTPSLRWEDVHPTGFVVFDGQGDFDQAVPHFDVQRGARYSFKFFARMRTAARAADVHALLATMGWERTTLVAIKRDMRLPGRPGASMTRWYATGTWARGSSVVTEKDPIFVENLCPIAGASPLHPTPGSLPPASPEGSLTARGPVSVPNLPLVSPSSDPNASSGG